jgi:hypothetical protein
MASNVRSRLRQHDCGQSPATRTHDTTPAGLTPQDLPEFSVMCRNEFPGPGTAPALPVFHHDCHDAYAIAPIY